ncbi:jg8906 [Pararge aegeria aegeria]|uniref:Jg8906 protein n=1 Tax=Pararge aegeria aegeria TaxID=348720 RepID=A0A8S4SDR5_9NEOP|nr:jg8906 [Pararge aegeria aegeria]
MGGPHSKISRCTIIVTNMDDGIPWIGNKKGHCRDGHCIGKIWSTQGTDIGAGMAISHQYLNAALVDPRQGGYMVSNKSQGQAGPKRHKTVVFKTPYTIPISCIELHWISRRSGKYQKERE